MIVLSLHDGRTEREGLFKLFQGFIWRGPRASVVLFLSNSPDEVGGVGVRRDNCGRSMLSIQAEEMAAPGGFKYRSSHMYRCPSPKTGWSAPISDVGSARLHAEQVTAGDGRLVRRKLRHSATAKLRARQDRTRRVTQAGFARGEKKGSEVKSRKDASLHVKLPAVSSAKARAGRPGARGTHGTPASGPGVWWEWLCVAMIGFGAWQ